jgi:tRNA dimethylallyltransferase
MRRSIVALAGATATGKTALGAALAARLGGEVVCADARQVFRELEIGTGKPTPQGARARPHHLFDWAHARGAADRGRLGARRGQCV